MTKRFDQNQYNSLVDLIERKTGKSVSDRERQIIVKGADEIDLVRSGLEETMIGAYHQVREIMVQRPKIQGLRTASFVSAIGKISNDYLTLGIFP
jgi:glutamate dehydrogenase (NAD(P)+)